MTNKADVVNEAATEALGNAMYRYSFGIVGSGRDGTEGVSLGTGVGLLWKDTYLVVTAAHTMEITPYDKLYFLLPGENLHFELSTILPRPLSVHVRKRLVLENPKSLLAENGEDLAAFILEEQEQELGQRHFYPLSESSVSLELEPSHAQVGVLGYPGVTRIAIGDNFIATPYLTFGEVAPLPSGYNPQSHVSIRYQAAHTVSPRGLSGGGFWVADTDSRDMLWMPSIKLIGLATDWMPHLELLIGYSIAEVIRFLMTKRDWMKKR
jgi:hypothetical protein